MERLEESLMRFEELWFEQDIAILCGGWIELLVDAITKDERLTLRKENSSKKEKWRVELIGGMQKMETPLWIDNENISNELHPEEDDEGSVADEQDSELGWDSANAGEQSAEVTIVSKSWKEYGSGWGELNSWMHADSIEAGGEGDVGGGAWGSTNLSWGSPSDSNSGWS